MNTNDNHDFPDALRWQLRALRQDTAPAHDLWPGIAARLTPQAVPVRPFARQWLRSVALAASLVLVVGSVGWFARTSMPTATSEAPASGPTLVQREADGLTRQYQAALQEMQAPMPASLQPTVDALDRDVALIHAALERDPDSVLLLEQLRRTYAHRLALVQRVAYT
ncbi:hypothetical protein [Lysobacter tyrosinilyticus]